MEARVHAHEKPTRMESRLKSRVLLWGNSPPLDSHMVAALRSESCEVTLATGRRQALGITRGHLDVLVLDFAFHSREFSQPASRHCRTFVLAESLEQLILALERRVDAALVKPLGLEQVRTVIRNLLGGARMQVWAEDWHPQHGSFLQTHMNQGSSIAKGQCDEHHHGEEMNAFTGAVPGRLAGGWEEKRA